MAIWNQSGVIKLVDAGQGANCYGFTPCNFRAANTSINRLLAGLALVLHSDPEVHDDARAAGAGFHEV